MVIFSCIVIASGIAVFKSDFHWSRLWSDPNEVYSFYSFQPSTVYFFVNYMDQFLSARCLPETNGWHYNSYLLLACYWLQRWRNSMFHLFWIYR
ncbi:hypothetical protein GIB67_042542 [Kingdonia uniflora]|uniref:Uncharacterized protein n=1 Tax=Kingdonia uniflora TaxID=39325 RepID=A0A7J7M144_9MAGN|nr:hypothetical protein GIB67_042542 [Kingdonia uniflora]